MPFCESGTAFIIVMVAICFGQKRINLIKAFVMTALIKDYPLPLYLKYKAGMSDEELFEFCSDNKHLRIERDENDQLIILAPTGGETGRKHVQILLEIEQWNRKYNCGKTFDSSTGFQLSDTSMRSPDAAWITAAKWDSLTLDQREKFLPFAPDFVVEVLSPTDHVEPAHEKMRKWIENGTHLAWLIVPKKQTVFIYRIDGTVDKVEGFDKTLSGEEVLPGFIMDLSILV